METDRGDFDCRGKIGRRILNEPWSRVNVFHDTIKKLLRRMIMSG